MKMFSACVSLLLLSACSSSPPYPAYAIEDDAEVIASVVLSDIGLQEVVKIGHAHVDRKPDGQLHVIVPVRNIDDEQIQVLAQISFRDAQQAPLGDTTNRQVLTIPPGSTLDLEFLSRNREAVDYVVRISWNK